MAVSAVKVVSIIGLLRYLEPVIQVCGKSEIFHPDDALSFYSDTHNFTPLFEENPYSPALGTLKNLLQSVEKKPVLVPNTNELSFSDEELFCYVERINKTLEPLISRKSELHGQIEQCKKLSAEISHFVGLNLDLEKIFSCQFIKVRLVGCRKRAIKSCKATRKILTLPFLKAQAMLPIIGAYILLPLNKALR